MNTNVDKFIKIDLNIGDQLTSISCGHIVVELIKFLAYQRLQIPYTYPWLKQLITKRKAIENKKESYQSERHFHIASTALENLDFIIKSLLKEIDSAVLPEEICIALGATPVSCKEIYRILMPHACHKPQCHSNNIASDQKIQKSVFRNLVTSDKLSKVFFDSLAPTNMYVFVKKIPLNNQDVVCSDQFVLINGYKIPKSCKVIVLDFRSHNPDNISCCNKFEVFGDVISNSIGNLVLDDSTQENYFSDIESSNKVKWFQSSYVMKGFKDSFINGCSVTNTWLDS
ncbi:unnamed protein product [Danaus chrysippus]|uniref:(African queen) hypothetical protein n=1 Tax=Danaus chrysippus TaxID=151541 RepID=A0A8J2QUE0_9NEOP|nr:unnamed protein product [Danaus chrysippus]